MNGGSESESGDASTERGTDQSAGAEERVKGGHDRTAILFLDCDSLRVHGNVERAVADAEGEQRKREGDPVRGQRQQRQHSGVNQRGNATNLGAANPRGEQAAGGHGDHRAEGHDEKIDAEHRVAQAAPAFNRRQARDPRREERAVDEKERGDGALWKTVAACDRVVHGASSGRGGVDAYREVFLEGARLMNVHQPAARRLLVSSTSVYGQTGGEWVTEESTAGPAIETGKVLREAERVALAVGAIVVRSAGIYGPGRTVLLEKLKRGEAIIEGDGSRWMNQVHRDDLVAAIALLLERGEPGQIYNVADDAPVRQRDYYAWCSERLMLPLPPSGPANPHKKRGNTNKRVSNTKLRALGWKPKFPSFKEGIASLLKSEPGKLAP